MDLAGTLGPWYNFARFFGYFPAYGLRLDYASWEAITGVTLTLILSLGNIGLHSVVWWTIPVKSNYFSTTIGSRVEVTFNIVDSVVPVVTILLNLLLFGRAKKLFAMLQEADQLLGGIHIRLEYRQQRLYSMVVLFLVLGMQLMTPAIIPLSDSQYFMDLLPITVYMTYRQLSNLSFLGSIMMILMAVFLRFKCINVCLLSKFIRSPGSIVAISMQDDEHVRRGDSDMDPLVVITNLSRIHQILCEAVEQINFVFSFQVRTLTVKRFVLLQ